MGRILIAVALLIAAAAPVAAQRATPVAPTYQAGIDVIDYDIGITLPDTGAFIRGDVTIAFRRNVGLDHIAIDLVDSLTVRRVESSGAVLAFTRTRDRILVSLPGRTGAAEAATAQDSLSIRILYDGRVSDGLIARKDNKGRWTWFGDNWPNRGHQWLPLVDHPSDKASVTFRITAAPSVTVVANGLQTSLKQATIRGALRKVTTWRESRAIAPYLMVIGAGPLVRFDVREPSCHYGDEGQCVRQSVYVKPENRHWLPGVFSSVGPIVSFFEGLVGSFPYEKLSHVESTTRFGGMENASAIFYDGALFPKEKLSDGLVAHETAHQWFGDAVTEREWGHLWLSEGFATYFAALWTQYIRGDSSFTAEMSKIRTQVMSDKVVATHPVIDSNETNYLALLNANSYQKGGYVLFMLHQQLGDSTFFTALKSYYRKYRHGTTLSDDLRAEFEQASGHSLGQFFDQWLRRPGFAQPSIGWSRDPLSGAVSLSVFQDGATGAYELNLPTIVTGASGEVTRTTVTIPALAHAIVPIPGTFREQPRSITFDTDRLLARVVRL